MVFASSCSILVNRKLPIKQFPEIKEKKNLIITSPYMRYPLNREELETFFRSSKMFNEVKVIESFSEIQNKSNYDLNLEINFTSDNFFEPYCLVTLTIIPCTPPERWILAAKVTDLKHNNEKKYLLKEDAMIITWIFGFLFSGSGKSDNLENDLLKNMLINLTANMKDDKIL